VFSISLFRYGSISEIAIRPSEENGEKRKGGQVEVAAGYFKTTELGRGGQKKSEQLKKLPAGEGSAAKAAEAIRIFRS
jgi:hypothetical protein